MRVKMKNDNYRKGWAFVLTLMMVFTTLFGGFSFLGLNGAVEEVYAADVPAYAEGEPAGIEGAELTYTISTETQLRALATTVSSGSGIKYEHTTFILQNDLSLTDGAWTPIGVKDIVFAGTFDGGDKTISGDLINSHYQLFGLFGHTSGSAIKNLRVNVTIISNIEYGYIGGLVAMNKNGTIENCSVTANIIDSASKIVFAGGLVGENIGYLEHTGIITNSYATGDVKSDNIGGGLVGMNTENGIITNCYAEGNVNGKYVGGLVGINKKTIINCSATGNVEGENVTDIYAGGFAGCNEGLITNSYSAGTVTAGALSEVGGLVGENTGLITNCYSTVDVSGTIVGGLVGKNYWDRGAENKKIKGTIANSYATGYVTGVTGYVSTVGGLVGQNIDVGQIENGYWNSTENSTLKGVGEGAGDTVSMASIAMTNAAFVTILNVNLDYHIKDRTLYLWQQTDSYPTFSTTLWGSVTVTCTPPPIGEKGTNAAIMQADLGKYQDISTVWSKGEGAYVAGEIPVAVITLTGKEDYRFTGLLASSITVAGGVVTYETGQDVSTDEKSVVFTVTYPKLIKAKGSGGSAASTVINTNTGAVTEGQLNNAIGAAKDGGTVTINSPKTDEVVFPASGFDKLTEKANGLAIVTENGTLIFDSKAVKAMNDQASGKEIKLSMKEVEKATLTKEELAKVGDRKVYDLTVMSEGKLISSFDGGKVTVSIPYLVNPGENTDDIGVWYMADDGSLTYIKCVYDPKAKSVTFTVDHFSKYVIGYYGIADWMNPFSDVKSGAWYYDAVAYVNMKSLMKGNSITSFEPQGLMTRGMLVTILGRMEAAVITTYEKSKTFSDVSSTQYYAPYIEWAKDQGIVKGVGNDKFAPNSGVTREDMAVIITNYLKFKGQGPVGAWAIHLKYSDLDKISPWTGEGVMFVTMKGLMKGVGNDDEGNPLFAPGLNSTRAQAAQVIMNLGERMK